MSLAAVRGTEMHKQLLFVLISYDISLASPEMLISYVILSSCPHNFISLSCVRESSVLSHTQTKASAYPAIIIIMIELSIDYVYVWMRVSMSKCPPAVTERKHLN